MSEVSMHDGLIFDLDGTLWDCSAVTASAVNTIFNSVGITEKVSNEFIRSISGRPVTETEELVLGHVPIDKRQQVQNQLDDIENEFIQKQAKEALLPGVEAGLLKLYQKYKLCVVSNCSTNYLATFLQFSSVGHLFIDSECYGRTLCKKSENIEDVILRQGFLSPCYIGDTESDMYASKEAGITFYYAEYGFGNVPSAKCKFTSFKELTEYFLK